MWLGSPRFTQSRGSGTSSPSRGCESTTKLAKVVTQELAKLEGIERTQTMVAFQQFSAHDLESMFGLGLEEKSG